MNNHERIWIWSAAALSFVVGAVLVFSGTSAGWLFFIIGIGYLAAASRAGREWFSPKNAALARWGLVAATVLLVVLVVVVAAVFLLK